MLQIEEGDLAKVTAVIVPSRAALVQLDIPRAYGVIVNGIRSEIASSSGTLAPSCRVLGYGTPGGTPIRLTMRTK